MSFTPRLLAVLTGTVALFSPVHARNYRVTVAAAEVDRVAQVVTFELPFGISRLTGVKQGDGTMLPLQLNRSGSAAFIIPRQKAGEALTFMLSEGAAAPDAVMATRGEGRLHLMIDGKPMLDYQMDKEALPRPDIKPEYKRAGYLHPIYTSRGRSRPTMCPMRACSISC
jgi:hypothetical protein